MITNYIKLLRIPHWIKNLFVFVPLVFSKHLSDPDSIITVLIAFVVFSLTSSAVYIFNDIFDAEYDRNHTVKKERPIASGIIKPGQAWIVFAFIIALVAILSLSLNFQFRIILAVYLFLNILYSMKLKEVVIIDLMIIAAGFMLRVLGGAYVLAVDVSNWLILTTLFLSLFLAVMKRKSETQLPSRKISTRKVLLHYSNDFINQIAVVSASGLAISYALYTVSERTVNYFHTDNLAFTVIFVLYGIFRYSYLVYVMEKGENAIELFFYDAPMIINALLYILSVISIIYFV